MTQEPLWTKRFFIVTICNLLLCLTFQMLVPVLPVLVEQMGASGVQIGLVMTVYTLAAVIIRPFAGHVLDRWNRRVALSAALVLYIACTTGYYMLSTVLLVLLLRFLHGISWGITTTTYSVFASEVVPSKRLGEGMGYFGLSFNLALALGPLIGLALLNDFGFGPLFSILTGLSVLLLVLSQFLPYRKQTHTAKQPVVTGSFVDRLVEKRALFPSILVFFVGINYGGILTFLPLFGKEAGLAQIGLFYLINAVFIVLVRPISGRLFDRKGNMWVLVPAAFFWGSGLFVLSYAHSLATMITASLLFGIGYGAVYPALQALAVHRAGPARRGMATGTFFSFYDLGIGLGSLGLGVIAKYSSYAVMYRYSALIPVF
ncbi:MAG: MFS transporter, partial [Clostridia bacterium]